MMWVWHTGLAGLSNTHRTVGTLSSPRAHSCQQSNAYVEGESSLQIRQLSQRSCSLRRVSKIFVEIFHEHLQIHKIHEIKDPQKILRYMVVCSLVPRPHPLTRKRVWWLLSTSLAVPSQQSWFLNNWTIISVLFHWLVQNRYCWHFTTKKVLNAHKTLFLVRGWGLGTRLVCISLVDKISSSLSG